MPITVLGTPGGIFKPQMKLNTTPLVSLNAQFPVGQMARAAFSVKPEHVKTAMGGGSIEVDGKPLFTGTGFAPRGRATSASLDFGFSLIHPSHRIDEGRCWAPGLHPMSTEHYTFTMGGSGKSTLDQSMFGDQRLFKFDLTKSLAEEIPDFIRRGMEKADQQRASTNLAEVGLDGNVALNAPEVLAALAAVEGIGPCKLNLEAVGDIGISISASRYAQGLMQNSIAGNKSAWDLLTIFFSAFGMQVICWPDGTIKACPDFTGCKPPDGNRITGDIIDTWEGSAEYTRSPRGVQVISFGFTKGFSGAQPPAGQALDPIAGNQGEYITNAPGGLFITGLPGWMMPIQNGGLPVIPKEYKDKYAKQIFAEVKNMGRTFVVSTPICPDARPGTTYYFETVTNAKNLTDGGEAETPFSAEYAGYCYKITHSANAQGQFHTHWHFRNVFDPSEYDLMVDEAPFFGDKPFEVPYSGGGGGGEGGGEDGGRLDGSASGNTSLNTSGANFSDSL